MTRKWIIALFGLLAVGGLAIAGVASLLRHGISARDEPSALEAMAARTMRRLAIPAHLRDATNPLPASAEILSEGRAHFADHCATCHANDGSGDTEIGRNLYPKAPDMRLPTTQSLSDGELFYVIHNGIRLTGMPAWGGADPVEDRDSWKLVHFIRHLPQLSAEERSDMKALNPKSRHEIEEEDAMAQFLNGGAPEAVPPSH